MARHHEHPHADLTPESIDTDSPAVYAGNLFGLPTTRERANIIVTPIPFDGTVSWHEGAADGPQAVLDASLQVDLYEPRFGEVHKAGIYLDAMDPEVRERSRRVRECVLPIAEAGGVTYEDERADLVRLLREVDETTEWVESLVHDATVKVLRAGKIPGLLGGEHGLSFGAIAACAAHAATALKAKEGIGVLQIDAHRDLRRAYLGMKRSHASVMRRVVDELPGVARIVQVGIRDVGPQEDAYAGSLGDRCITCTDAAWSRRLDDGGAFTTLISEAIDPLPEHVYISFDIDGLQPYLCPGTGTPVPGGLNFGRACEILVGLARSGRSVVGFDLVEVSPTNNDRDWNGNVGARILHALCGCTAASQGLIELADQHSPTVTPHDDADWDRGDADPSASVF
jgi:agmatinase